MPQSKNGLMTTDSIVWPRLSSSLGSLGVVEPVGEQRLVAVDLAVDRLRVRVEQQLGRVAALAPLRVVGAVHPVAVALAGPHRGQVAVPDEAVDLGQLDAALGAVVVDEAELDPVGDLREQGEVRARPVVRGAEGVGLCQARSARAAPGGVVVRDVRGGRGVLDEWPSQTATARSTMARVVRSPTGKVPR